MKDEEIKLPNSTGKFDEHFIGSHLLGMIKDYAREAVRLNQPQAEPLPFNLEAAKRGDPVLHNGQDKRWIGLSVLDSSLNIVECDDGLDYAPDRLLFMKPKPMRTIYLIEYADGSYNAFDNKTKVDDYIGEGCVIHELKIPS